MCGWGLINAGDQEGDGEKEATAMVGRSRGGWGLIGRLEIKKEVVEAVGEGQVLIDGSQDGERKGGRDGQR